jgi:hypothetical protein
MLQGTLKNKVKKDSVLHVPHIHRSQYKVLGIGGFEVIFEKH